jgi:peptidoglycan hydrolase-like protein with peptidoglycan-binding domain
VLKQQQELIAKGAKIKADGVMGPATQAAIKQFAAAPAAGAGRGFVNPTAPAAPTAVAAAKPPAPQTGAAGQAARAASGKAPTQVAARQSTAAVKESQEISRMRFLAGLSKD